MTVSQCVYWFSPTDKHLGFSSLRLLYNNIAVNIYIQLWLWMHIFISFGSRPWKWKCFLRNSWTVFKSGCTISHSYQQYVFRMPQILSTFRDISIFSFSHSNVCEVIFHCGSIDILLINDIGYLLICSLVGF